MKEVENHLWTPNAGTNRGIGKKTRVAVFIGRFAPLHNGHIENIKYCMKHYDKIIILVGSGNKRRTSKNPFHFEQIKKWILSVCPEAIVLSINDYIYNDQKWISQVQAKCKKQFPRDNVEFTLVGHHKDASSYYLDMFPTWKIHETPEYAGGISATEIRNYLFNSDGVGGIEILNYLISKTTKDIAGDLISFLCTPEFENIMEEIEYFKKEDKKFENYPYKQTLKFNCSDAVVVCEGHVLLIERKFAPGKGTWALPGGFVNRDESYKQAAIRELYEETGLKVPEKVLNGSFHRSKIFDNPQRNMGIPRITNAFYFTIAPDIRNGYSKLPKIKTQDDAINVKWVPLSDVNHMTLFDDHSDIIEYFVNLY